MSEHQIFIRDNDYSEFGKFILSTGCKKILLVCGRSIERLQIGEYINSLERDMQVSFIRFSGFQPNPQYDSVIKGIEKYREEDCEAILAVGGGSAMDIAKCIKLFYNMNLSENCIKQQMEPNDIKLFAVPTTSGTGSEATRYAVIYQNGEKQSVSDYSCIPSMVVFDASTLQSLPEYQKKVTMLDALCHAIESFWSVNSTEESRGYSKEAIQKILLYLDSYLKNESEGNIGMLEASTIAGKAINITQTTAGHAMCYKLTSLYGLAHGHAAALCVSKLWQYMINNTADCTDSRGQVYLDGIFMDIADAFGCTDSMSAIIKFADIIKRFELEIPKATVDEYLILKKSVNPVRLKNNPVSLSEEAISLLYHEILKGEGE